MMRNRWRGILVIVTWILWLPLYPVAEMFFRILFTESRRCSIEGCAALEGWPGWVSAGVWIGVPLLITVWWWRRRGTAPSN